MNKRVLLFFAGLILLLATFIYSCSPDDESPMEEPQECYRCTFPLIGQGICDSAFVNEICVIAPHENSLQMVLEITEKCHGEIINTSEEIRFLEDVLAEQQAAGADCERF